MQLVMKQAVLAATALLCATMPARGQTWSDALLFDPPTFQLGSYELRLGGFAHGAAFAATQSGGPFDPDGYHETSATGQARAELRLQRIYDSGLIVGAQSRVLILRHELSGDIYGNDALEKFSLYMQTGLGRVEVGQTDGVAYAIGVTPPTVDTNYTLENPNSVFFRDPVTHKAFNAFAQEVTLAASSSNRAKINLLTPRLFGAQVGLSYTPSPVKAPLPLIGNPSNAPNVQGPIWEGVAAYQTRFSDLAVGISAAYARGALRNPTPGHAELYDLALGIQFMYPVGDVNLSAGAAYRVSNGYGFNPGEALDGRSTKRVHLSAMASTGPWRFGGEYSHGSLDGIGALPDIGMNAYQLGAGFSVNDDIQLTAGWQWYDYDRTLGSFYNGAQAIDMNAGFIGASYALR
jgi:hypothetical protein